MKYDQLPVYKSAYDLLLEIFHASQTMKREYRYSLGEEVKKRMVEMMTCIWRANVSRNKEPHILLAREHVEVIRLQLRLLHDLRQLPMRNMASTSLKMESISKQLAAWHKTFHSQPKPQKEPVAG